MGWSATFLDALQARTHAPRFRLEVSAQPSSPGATGVVLHSHQGSGLVGEAEYAISRGSVRVSGGSVATFGWGKSFGGLVVGIHGGASAVTNILQLVVRGSLVRLFVGFEGFGIGDFEPVFTGQVRQIRGTPQRGYTLECWDIVRALGTRWTTRAGQQPLFHALSTAGTTIASSPYGVTDTSIEVANTSTASRESGGKYLLLVTGDAGNDFYLLASSVSGNVFTVTASDNYGTTREAAAVGKKVLFRALLQDHPKDIVRKILISTGTAGAAHAAFDQYPADWSFACPADWVDIDDITDAMTRGQVDTTVSLDVVVTAEQEDPYTWLAGVLEDKGFFLVHRQGQISLRAATYPYMSTTSEGTSSPGPGGVINDFNLTDSDIESVLDWQAWDGSRSVEYEKFIPRDASGANQPLGVGEAITTLPSTVQHVFNIDHAWTGGANWTDDVYDRLHVWAHRIPERVSLLLYGLTHAGLCEGDIGTLTSAFVPSRDPEGTENRGAMVLSVEPDWLNGTVRIDLALPPLWITEHA